MYCRRLGSLFLVGLAPVVFGILPSIRAETGLPIDAARVRLGPSLDLHLAIARHLRARLREESPLRGGGASVANLLIIQTGFIDEDGENVFLWLWDNPASNPAGITLSVEGQPVLDDRTGEPVKLPGATTSYVSFGRGDTLYLGKVSREVQGAGITSKDELIGLRAQPFGDPTLQSESGPADPGTGKCSMVIEITNSSAPGFYSLSAADQDPLDEDIPGNAKTYSIPGLAPGNHCVTLTGWLSQGGNEYLGDSVETCADISCEILRCIALRDLRGCQQIFGPGEADNSILLSWSNGEPSYEAILLTLDGEVKDPLGGETTELLLEGLAPGDHEVLLEGDCGGDKGKSTPTSLSFKLVDVAPKGEAPKNIACKFLSPDFGRVSITWKNGTLLPQYTEVSIIDAESNVRVALTVSGAATSANVEGTVRTDMVGLRSFYSKDGACYSSDLVGCEPTPPPGFKYLTGDCDGNSNLDLTDPVFSLNHLFKGGAPAVCNAACDSNRDERFDLSDAVYTLNHLFLGGPPPGGNYPDCDEGFPDSVPGCPATTCTRG